MLSKEGGNANFGVSRQTERSSWAPSYLRRGPNIYRQIDIDMYTISVLSDRQTDRQIIKLTDRQREGQLDEQIRRRNARS